MVTNTFNGVNDGSNDDEIWCAARGYLLYLPKGTLFINKNAISVLVSYLVFFIDLNDINSYVWGSVCLTYLYI